MRPARDLTDEQYKAALKRNGFEHSGFLGYVYHKDDPNFHIPPVFIQRRGRSLVNHRASLAHAIQSHDKRMRRREEKNP